MKGSAAKNAGREGFTSAGNSEAIRLGEDVPKPDSWVAEGPHPPYRKHARQRLALTRIAAPVVGYPVRAFRGAAWPFPIQDALDAPVPRPGTFM